MLNKMNYLIFAALLMVSCKGDVGPMGINSLVSITSEPSGSNCAAGGLRIDVGPDANRNGSLDLSEIKSTQFVCNGVNGANSLVNTTTVSPGADCIYGGIKIDVGVDKNENGSLESAEVQSTRFICNGKDGLSIDQIRFQLISLTGLGSSSTTGELAPEWMYLRNFSKKDYSLLTSATLSAYIDTNSATASCTVDLFNITDNVVIVGSEVSTNSTTKVWVDSGNFLDNLPDKTIDLAIRLRTSSSSGFSECIQAYLVFSKN
ncbi:MAG: hypothetical protein JSS79_10865 [Bacteroidetes bacterium]|nr:hypothetical protein [Bacteroidota bacterium]